MKYWELYYRGTFIGKWAEWCKSEYESKINKGLFKDYLNLKIKLEKDIRDINHLEEEVIKKYPLLKVVPMSVSSDDNKIFLEELIVYINSKT
jgi:hypothetical protein